VLDEWFVSFLDGAKEPWIYMVAVGALLSFIVTARKKIIHDLEILEKLRSSGLKVDSVIEDQIKRSLLLSIKLTYGWAALIPSVMTIGCGIFLVVIALLMGELAALKSWNFFVLMAIMYPFYLFFFYGGLVVASSKRFKELEAFLNWKSPANVEADSK
jgi:hypothetical protein